LRRTGIRGALLAAALCLLAVASVAGDRIVLTNGREVRGRIVEETDEKVVVELAMGGRMEFARSRVKEIVRDAAPEESGADEPEDRSGELTTEATFLVYGPERRLRGWRRTREYRRGEERLFESVTAFLEDGDEPAVRVHVVEVAGPDLSPRAFTYRENVEGKPEFLRRGEVSGTSMRVSEARLGDVKARSIPFPSGTSFPAAARAAALARRGELRGEVETAVFDPVSGDFETIVWSYGEPETVEHDGRPVEVTVLRSRRGRILSEERIGPDGRTVTAELNGPSLVAVAVPPERVDRLERGEEPEGREAEEIENRRADLEAGFAVRKPGPRWTFERGEGMRRLTIKNLDRFAYVDILRDTSLPRGTLLETFALNLERRLAAESEEYRKESDGFGTLGGERAYRLECTSRRKGERIRSLVVATIHEGRAWIVIAACPVDYFGEARKVFDEILESFEFLE
jgi:hypothetical protein